MGAQKKWSDQPFWHAQSCLILQKHQKKKLCSLYKHCTTPGTPACCAPDISFFSTLASVTLLCIHVIFLNIKTDLCCAVLFVSAVHHSQARGTVVQCVPESDRSPLWWKCVMLTWKAVQISIDIFSVKHPSHLKFFFFPKWAASVQNDQAFLFWSGFYSDYVCPCKHNISKDSLRALSCMNMWNKLYLKHFISCLCSSPPTLYCDRLWHVLMMMTECLAWLWSDLKWCCLVSIQSPLFIFTDIASLLWDHKKKLTKNVNCNLFPFE